LDSSVVLRILFGEKNPLKQWKKIRLGFSSRLLRLECLRTIDRIRFRASFTPKETALYLSGLQDILSHLGILPITPRILESAEQAFPTPLGTLDGIHLATALLWRKTHGGEFSFATHDEELALAAQAQGFKVIGI